MNLDLSDKNAMVCGASAGIGAATVRVLAALGARVTLVARNADKLTKVLQSLDNQQEGHDFLVADFSDPKNLEKALSELPKERHYHILVNNTGGPKGGPIFTASTDEFTQAFAQHLVCNQLLSQALVPGMKAEGYGRIINIISTSVKQPIDGLGVSNTIRGAVANWAKTLANELGPDGITVNNVLPGFTATGRLADIVKNASGRFNKSEEEAAEFMRQLVPARRFAKAEEIANAVAFLASPAAGYINGINLPVDGGRTKSL